jgi:parallel beta-helix repeat protein
MLLLNISFASGAVLGATVTVTNTSNYGVGTLRRAILLANANPGTTITFSITGAGSNGVHTIRPTSALPRITADGTVVDGTTQTARSNSNPYGPEIELDFSSSGGYDYYDGGGILVEASNCVIKGLVINRFVGAGIYIRGIWTGSSYDRVTNNKVEACYIGTDATGTAASVLFNNDYSQHSMYGIKILEANTSTIGGNSNRNVISGVGVSSTGNTVSPSAGIQVQNSDGNLIQNSHIGTNAVGNGCIPNRAGIVVTKSHDNNIGGSVLAARNVVSGNKLNGIFLREVSGTKIRDNYIGTDASGTQALGNGLAGVELSDSSDNTIGELGNGTGNIISGNRWWGVYISGTDTVSSRNSVAGNSIGTDEFGITAIPNLLGISIAGRAERNSAYSNRIAFVQVMEFISLRWIQSGQMVL